MVAEPGNYQIVARRNNNEVNHLAKVENNSPSEAVLGRTRLLTVVWLSVCNPDSSLSANLPDRRKRASS